MRVNRRIVSEARSAFVILDTTPSRHTLPLMDASGAHHQQILRNLGKRQFVARVITPLIRLQDPTHTSIVLVTLPETNAITQKCKLGLSRSMAQRSSRSIAVTLGS